jgi:hypothetical protein
MYAKLLSLLAFSAIPSLVSAGATQESCMGVTQNDRTNILLTYENVQSQSMPTICRDFIKEFHKSCDNSDVNCNSDSYKSGVGSHIIIVDWL